MQNILMVTTGGTISSFESQKGVFSAGAHNINPLLEKEINNTSKQLKQTVQVVQAGTFLSETLTPDHWLKIAQCIRSHVSESNTPYQAVMVTHGSDTLVYSAVAIAFLLSEINIPIVFVASLKSAYEEQTDALINIRSALHFAACKLKKDVYITFMDANRHVALYRALSTENIPSYSHTIPEFKIPPVAKIDAATGEVVFNQACEINFNVPAPSLQAQLSSIKKMEINRVKYFQIYPGLTSDDLINLIQPIQKTCDAVFFNFYHSGTASNLGDNNLEKAITFLNDHDIAVFATPFDGLIEQDRQYATTHALLDKGVHPLPVMSLSVAYVKLVILSHLYKGDSLVELMNMNILGEYI